MIQWFRPARPVVPLMTIGGIALLLLAVFAIWVPDAVLRAWLVAVLFVLGLSLGALAMLMLHNLTGGAWGEVIRPQLVALAGGLPIALLGFLPPLFFWPRLLPWTEAAPATLPEQARAKLAYFAPTFFTVRNLIIIVIWLGIAWGLSPWRRGASPDRNVRTSIAGLMLYMVTLIFFATDWMIAPDPVFYSTIYPAIEASGEAAGALALAIFMAVICSPQATTRTTGENVQVSEDLANLLFGFVLLWVYLSFMQWLVIWSGNLPDEIGWYLRRAAGPWLALLWAVILLHFVLPVAALLSRTLKRSPNGIASIAALCVAGHLADVIWRLAPDFAGSSLVLLLILPVALIGICGIWGAGVACVIAGYRRLARWRDARA